MNTTSQAADRREVGLEVEDCRASRLVATIGSRPGS